MLWRERLCGSKRRRSDGLVTEVVESGALAMP